MGNRPRNNPAAPGKNSNKAPKLKTHAKKKPSPEKKKQRSVFGFFTAAVSIVGVLGWALYKGSIQRVNDKRTLKSMSRKSLFITEHAECRMGCRYISRAQVEAALQQGRINNKKSDRNLKPCPKIVVDAEVPKPIQVVFSACRNETRLVTVIDRETNWPCSPC